MSIPLRQIPDGAIHALAVVLSLPPDRLERIGTHHRAKPAASWLSEQETRIPGLPHCFQTPSLPHISVKVGQVTKRVILAASGGADTLAAKAAVKGIHVDTILHPRSTPTVLCASHRDLHPTVLRDMFYYLSREVADHADLIRRHPHDDDTSHNDNCSRQWREVHDWGLRMIGMSALWCMPHTFRALERGRQPSVPGYRPRMHNNTHSCTSSTNQPVSSSASTCTTTPVPAPQIRSGLRLPHLEFPCEACVLAVVGARSQSLIDLRASMLSRMALDAYEKARRAKRQAEPTVRLDEADRYPNLWPLIESYITVMGMEYGEEVAEEIRLRSVALAQALFRTRACESRRQRHQARELRRLRSSSRSTKQTAEKKPPRMVTNRGHRLPLPLVPLDKDLWAHYNESIVGENPGLDQQHEEGDVFEVAEDNMNNDDDDYGNHDLYFVVQDCQDSLLLDKERNDGKAGQDGELTENLDCDAHTEEGRIEASVVESYTKPYWEDDYIRHILDSQTVISSAYGRPPARCENHDDDAESYVTVSVHTEAPMSVSSREDPALPPTQRTLSASSATPATAKGSRSSSVSNTQRSTASSSYLSQRGKTVQDMQNVQSHRNTSSTSSQTLQAYPPAPASSVYSQPEPSTPSRRRVDPVAQKSCGRPLPSSSRSRAPTTTSSRPSGTRSTAPSVLRSPFAPCSPNRAPSTIFVPPSNVRTPASTKSYLQQQADLVASFSSGSRGSSDSSRASSTVLSPATQSTTNTSVTYHSSQSQLQAQSQTSSQTSRTTRTAKYSPPSTATSASKSNLSRFLSPPKTKPCKAPSLPHSKSPPQPSAISTVQSSHAGRSGTSKSGASASASAFPLAILPKTTMRTHSRPTASPSTAPSSSHLRKATSPATPLASRPVNQATPTRHLPSKAHLLPPPPPAIVISNAKTAQWADSAPSTFAWDQPSPSLDPSFEEMLVAKGRKGDYLVLPDDSISVVAKADRKAQREKQKKDKQKAATPTRNLNHYQPAKSRGPPQAAPPASSLSVRPQNRRQRDAPTAVPPPRAISSRTPCYQEPPGSPASSCSTSSSRLVSTEARRSQTSQVTHWPSQQLMV
ncbi:hypothetical protein SEPCBS57363_004528 [Sporothrix epigloea]|uniref:Uncharacterized protein n=1 Tax=Sporothrix epigloea TaxID=1892477 RepID=A0ABP0DSH2_9PEZI